MAEKLQVLIPTLCTTKRRESVDRALTSLLQQTGVDLLPTLVINGKRFDERYKRDLEARPDILVHYLEDADLVSARRYARESVTTNFFSWLDDDDVYLPGAMSRRLAVMLEDPSIDAVVSNGYRHYADRGDELVFEDIRTLRRDPVGSLFKKNWLCAAGGLYRTSSISKDFFDASVRSLDMTFLALRLATEKKLVFLEEPTFRKNITPGSLSSSDAWLLPAAGVLKSMSGYRPLSRRHRAMVRRKLSAVHHQLSDHFRGKAQPVPAWTHHILSVCTSGGASKYAFYTRKLIMMTIKSLIGHHKKTISSDGSI